MPIRVDNINRRGPALHRSPALVATYPHPSNDIQNRPLDHCLRLGGILDFQVAAYRGRSSGQDVSSNSWLLCLWRIIFRLNDYRASHEVLVSADAEGIGIWIPLRWLGPSEKLGT